MSTAEVPPARAAAALRHVPLFAGVAPADLERLARGSRRVRVPAGSVIIREGGAPDALYVLLRGCLEVVRTGAAEQVVLGVHRPGAVVGEMALLGEQARTATVRATRPSQLLVIDPAAFRELLTSRPAAVVAILRTVATRLASTEAALAQAGQLAGLGRFAAGLAHELNNPAAAIRSAAARLAGVRARAEAAAMAAARVPAVAALLHDIAEPGDPVLLPARATEQGLAEWLARRGWPRAEADAAAFASCGWTAATLASLTATLPSDDAALLLEWLAARCDARLVEHTITRAAAAMGEVVRGVHTHAHPGAQRGPVDVAESLRAALVVMGARWRDRIDVRLDVPADIPAVHGVAGELGQVWSNLFANAFAALGDRGTLRIRVRSRTECVIVDVEDDGPGIPAALRRRLFEPFFTTRPPGAGTGLGLHIVHRIVVHGHGGRVAVRSRPGRTVFRVVLPALSPDAEPAP